MTGGVELTAAELREMIQGYYRARGWDENGFVSNEKLSELGVPDPDHGPLAQSTELLEETGDANR